MYTTVMYLCQGRTDRLALPNGLELREAALWASSPAARATGHSFSRIPAGKRPSTFRTPARSAEGPGARPGLQRVVGRTFNVQLLRLMYVLLSSIHHAD
jgi:hypothetical protein